MVKIEANIHKFVLTVNQVYLDEKEPDKQKDKAIESINKALKNKDISRTRLVQALRDSHIGDHRISDIMHTLFDQHWESWKAGSCADTDLKELWSHLTPSLQKSIVQKLDSQGRAKLLTKLVLGDYQKKEFSREGSFINRYSSDRGDIGDMKRSLADFGVETLDILWGFLQTNPPAEISQSVLSSLMKRESIQRVFAESSKEKIGNWQFVLDIISAHTLSLEEKVKLTVEAAGGKIEKNRLTNLLGVTAQAIDGALMNIPKDVTLRENGTQIKLRNKGSTARTLSLNTDLKESVLGRNASAAWKIIPTETGLVIRGFRQSIHGAMSGLSAGVVAKYIKERYINDKQFRRSFKPGTEYTVTFGDLLGSGLDDAISWSIYEGKAELMKTV